MYYFLVTVGVLCAFVLSVFLLLLGPVGTILGYFLLGGTAAVVYETWKGRRKKQK